MTLRLRDAAQLVQGKSVALVGNSARILKDKPGAQIDRADVVIRMNRGLPGVAGLSHLDIGARTTIWATAKYWEGLLPPADAKRVLWMKLTPLGSRQLGQISAQKLEHWRDKPMDVWPQRFEDECREFVGADPGTGIRLLWWLRTHCEPKSVSVYGMDCWEAASHWSGRKNTPNHKPALEREAMMRLL